MRLFLELGLLSLATGAVGLSATSGFVSVDTLSDREPEDAKLVHNALEAGSTERTVTFKPFERYWESLAEDSVLRDSEWKWRKHGSPARPSTCTIHAYTDPNSFFLVI